MKLTVWNVVGEALKGGMGRKEDQLIKNKLKY